MKYSDINPPIVCMQTHSTCYRGTNRMSIKGVLWHSTGANNPYIKRYVQPYKGDSNYNHSISVIGKNTSGNDWNHISHNAGLNCWVGKLADGTVGAVQTMPWDYKPWGCGSGKYGSCNDGWIQFEIAEDSLKDSSYFNAVYKEACEITAYLCKKFNINPYGYVVHNGVKVPTILCHADSCALGLGSNHGDVIHWFTRFGKTMADVRNDVADIINDEEDEDMTQERFNEMMNEYRKTLQDNDAGSWSKEARDFCIKNGIVVGSGTDENGQPNYMFGDFVTREQLMVIIQRLFKMMNK